MELRILPVDLFDCDVEAIVNPANRQPNLGLGSHISERIKKTAGRQVIDERKAHGTIEFGQAVHTSAGKMPFRYIVHAAILDVWDLNPLFLLRLRQRTSDETLRMATHNSLILAENLGVDSLAFSPMGAGIGAMKIEKCARIMLEETRQFEMKQSPQSLKRIDFAVKSEKAVEVFETVLEQIR